MRDTIIETEAMSRFDNAVDEVAAADHGLSGFILAYGQAGRGKSVAAKRYAKERGGTLVHVWQGWSQTAFMQNCLPPYAAGKTCRAIPAPAARNRSCGNWKTTDGPCLWMKRTGCASTA